MQKFIYKGLVPLSTLVKAKVSGEVAYRLYPASETEFFYRVADAQIKFVKNEQGQVERLVLHQNGRDIPARKVK